MSRRIRSQRRLTNFIPSADRDFALTANTFATHLADHAAECGVTEDEAAAVLQAVTAYRQALAKATYPATRASWTIAAKKKARKDAERAVRDCAAKIRANKNVSSRHKMVLRIGQHPGKLKRKPCPRRAPMLQYLGSRDGVMYEPGVGGTGSGVHRLAFWDVGDGLKTDLGVVRRKKPTGGERVELFVGLVPVGAETPSHPYDPAWSGRGWFGYLRSFSRSPFEVRYPRPAQPMLVCYWGRWADSRGEVGPFSKTCVARIEGGSVNPAALPNGPGELSALPGAMVRDAGRVEVDESHRPRLEEPARCVVVHVPYVLEAAADEYVAGDGVRQLDAA